MGTPGDEPDLGPERSEGVGACGGEAEHAPTPARPRKEVHRLILDVRFGDCDPAGIVYFPRYYDFFHQAMETWFPAELGFGYDQFVRDRKLGFPAVHSEADFERPSRFGERIEIHQRVTKLGRSSIAFAYEVFGSDGRRATGRSVCVVMNLDSNSPDHGKAVPMPDDLRARIEAFGITNERVER